MPRKQLIYIGISGAIAVAFGALGAHYLKGQMENGRIAADQLNGFETAVRYHLFHLVLMLLLIAVNKLYPQKWFDYAYAFFFWGILLFSGSLYVLCTRGIWGGGDGWKWLGPVTPLGGVCLIVGWIAISVAGLKLSKEVKK